MTWVHWMLVWLAGAFVLSILLKMAVPFYQAFSGPKKPQLTPKQEELNRQALIKRRANANRELRGVWQDQFNNLEKYGKPYKVESQQDNEKEKT